MMVGRDWWLSPGMLPVPAPLLFREHLNLFTDYSVVEVCGYLKMLILSPLACIQDLFQS